MDVPLKILILEDSPIDAEILRRLLSKEKLNFESALATNKETYLLALDQFQPDIILSDHSLPQFDSTLALTLARQKFPSIPFIMVTGAVSEEFAADIIKLGADDYILKDRLTRLPSAIEAALKQKQSEKEAAASRLLVTQSEEKYRTLVEQAFDGIIIYTNDGIIQQCNLSACLFLGYSKDELKGLNIISLFQKEDLIARPLYFESLKKGLPTLDYRRLKKKDGTFLEMEIVTKMMPNGELMAVGRDLTERKKAENKIRESETNLRTIFENTSEGFLLMNTDGIVKALNSKAAEYGFNNKESEIQVGELIYNFIEEERKDTFNNILLKVRMGNTIQYDRSYVDGKGNIKWGDFSITPVWESEIITGICITGRDITERKNAEEELNKNFLEKQELAIRMSAILNTLPANIALLDEEGVIMDVNDAWKSFATDNGFIGTSYGIGDDYIAISKNSLRDEEAEGIAVANGIEAVLGNRVKEFVYEYPCHSPLQKRWFRMVATSLQGKEYTGAVVMHIDISELRKMEQERLEIKIAEQKTQTKVILQAQEAERNAIGIELHDNVNQILVGTNLLLRMVNDHPEKLEVLIPSCIENIKNAITENRKIAHELVAPDLAAENLLQQILRLNSTMLMAAGLNTSILHKNFNEDLLNDEIKLAVYRILQEQCTNIIKHANAANVVVTLSTDDNVFTLQIADDGKGMSANQLNKGIGLRNITGRISIFSGIVNIETQPGKGFELEIKIPLT